MIFPAKPINRNTRTAPPPSPGPERSKRGPAGLAWIIHSIDGIFRLAPISHLYPIEHTTFSCINRFFVLTLFSHQNGDTHMSETPETACHAAARDRSIQARRAARLLKAKREERIVGLLNRGVSI